MGLLAGASDYDADDAITRYVVGKRYEMSCIDAMLQRSSSCRETRNHCWINILKVADGFGTRCAYWRDEMESATAATWKRRGATGDSVVVTTQQRKGRTMTRSTLGFTLTDVLVAIAILGMVVIVVIPKL